MDDIDERTIVQVTKGFYESCLKIETSAWEKGKVVAEFRGVNSAVTYAQMMRLTGRDEKSLKAWCELYEQYRDFDKFLAEYAKPRAEAWTRKALTARPMFGSVETPALPVGAFTVIYADPPWEYEFSETRSRSIETHYPTMAVDEIKALQPRP